MVNLKAITKPLTDKIEPLAQLVQEIESHIKQQTELQQRILNQVVLTNQNLNEIIDKLNGNQKGICKTKVNDC